MATQSPSGSATENAKEQVEMEGDTDRFRDDDSTPGR